MLWDGIDVAIVLVESYKKRFDQAPIQRKLDRPRNGA
jgi:hypothetical protein